MSVSANPFTIILEPNAIGIYSLDHCGNVRFLKALNEEDVVGTNPSESALFNGSNWKDPLLDGSDCIRWSGAHILEFDGERWITNGDMASAKRHLICEEGAVKMMIFILYTASKSNRRVDVVV